MSKHTPGPWAYGKDNDGWYLEQVGSNAQHGYALSEDDARRIVACVNAFDGIDLEKFEGKSVAEFVTSQTLLTGMGPDDKGGFGMQFEGGACQILAHAFADQFKRSGAINFLEVTFHSNELGELSVTMQRSNGKTPGNLLAEAKRQRDELLLALKTLCEQMPKGDGLNYYCNKKELVAARNAIEIVERQINSGV